MREIALFVEDHAHRLVIGTLVRRLAEQHGQRPSMNWLNSSHGFGGVVSALAEFVNEVHRTGGIPPDLIVVATDSNCRGHAQRRQALARVRTAVPIVHAVPDPHVERWLLLDGRAFKDVFGSGCPAPDLKCDRHRYKLQLTRAIREAGGEIGFHGIDYASEIASRMDIDRIAGMDRSFGLFVQGLRAVFREMG